MDLNRHVDATEEAERLLAAGWELPGSLVLQTLLGEVDCWPAPLTCLGPFWNGGHYFRYAAESEYLLAAETWYRSPIPGVSVAEILELAWDQAYRVEPDLPFATALRRVFAAANQGEFEAEQVLTGLSGTPEGRTDA